jgi:predicted AAA+ superfamily ATPase
VDDELDVLMPHLAAIALEGAKGVGKTATATQRSRTVVDLTDAQQRFVTEADPGLLVNAAPPVFVDEWQLVPATWDRIRRAVDDDPSGGRFLLAGSASPTRGQRVHSGAGRIVRLTMRPLSFPERRLTPPTVSLAGLLSGTGQTIGGHSDLRLAEYTAEILASGFPGLRGLPARAQRAQLDSYLARVVDHDLEENGLTVRRPAALTAWLTAYAAATSTTADYTAILDAATPGDGDKPARATVASYREALERQFLLEPVPAWVPSLSPLRRLVGAPKHHLVDPGLAARLLGVDAQALLRGGGDRIRPSDGPLLGALFESLVVQTVRVLAQAAEARVWHLRTKAGEHEVDLIVEDGARRVVAAEVKLNPVIGDTEVGHLLWLRQQIPDRIADLVVITTGQTAYRRPDGVAVVPLALLGP